MFGFFSWVHDAESRRGWGILVFAISGLILNFVFDSKIPDRDNANILFTLLDVVMSGLICIVFLQVTREVTFTLDVITKLFANPILWLCCWGLIAISRLKMCLRAVQSIQDNANSKLSDA